MDTTKLPSNLRKSIIQFMYYYANGTLPFVIGHSILNDGSYVEEMLEIPSQFESMMAVYINNIDVNENGEVANHKHAMKRAAQYIRMCIDGNYTPEPPFEDWEMEKHH